MFQGNLPITNWMKETNLMKETTSAKCSMADTQYISLHSSIE